MNPKGIIKTILHRCGFGIHADTQQLVAEATSVDIDIYNCVKEFTMTSPDRVWALINAVNYIVKSELEGDFVECGVWRGGSAMAIASKLKSLGKTDREVWLYDTFSGMTVPSGEDIEINTGNMAGDLYNDAVSKENDGWCYASESEVTENIKSTGYPMENVQIIKGDVITTLETIFPEKIALLRLDTDWYESTAKELEILYPRLVSGGVCIIDDYGHWQGAKKAVDEYFEKNKINVLLNKVDYTGRLFIKP